MEQLFFYVLGALSAVGVWLIFSGLGDLKKPKVARDAGRANTAQDSGRANTAQTDDHTRPISKPGIVMTPIAILVGIVVGFIYLTMPSGTDSTAGAEQACVRWFKRSADLGGADAFASTSWEKDGKIVVKVGFDMRGQEYSTRLCVYDPVTGDMSAPNNLTRSRWE